MLNVKLALRAALPMLALAAVTACGPSHTGATASGSPVSAASSASGTSIPGVHEQTTTYTFDQAITTLVVDGGAGNVTVTGSARTTTEVTEHLYYSRQVPGTTRTISGGTLTAGYSCPIQVTCLVSYDVAVPRAVAVKATTRAGAIRINEVTGAVTASAGAGNIHAAGIASGSASFTTLAGTITASFTAPPTSVTATSHAGRVTIEVPGSVSYDVTAQTYVGSATISVPRDDHSSRTIKARTDLGDVTVSAS
jgi:hypothetical protein